MNNDKINRLLDLIKQSSMLRDSDGTLDLEQDLFSSGQLDSFSILTLVQRLEDEFEIIFDYNDIQETHFRNAKAIIRLLENKYKV